MVTSIEPPLTFLEEQKKAILWDTVEPSHVPFGLVPEVLDPIDVILPVSKALRVIDSNMVEVRDIQDVIALESICVDDAIREDHSLHDREQCCTASIGYHDCIDPATTLQQPENRNFSSCSPTSFAFPDATEIALIDFYLASDGRSFFHFIGNDFPQTTIKRCRSISINTHELSNCACRRPGNEMLYEPCSLLDTEPTLSRIHGAILTLSSVLS